MRWRKVLAHQKLRERARKECVWHKWFAWYPVIIEHDEGSQTKAWLEFVGRKRMIRDVAVGDYYETKPAIRDYKFCPIEDLLVSKLKNDKIVNKSHTFNMNK